ncbi:MULTISPECIES: hypothetical protein [unclassified Micromonospora]|nr:MULTISPECIES: hypothetical protein [unclassified Micromonospora]MCZ7474723.1 hypothetical protein [Micromonospora sp. WMMC273]WBC05355.1 hypothetical protein O7546_10480 [Micromonospora sp. WMMA1976]
MTIVLTEDGLPQVRSVHDLVLGCRLQAAAVGVDVDPLGELPPSA